MGMSVTRTRVRLVTSGLFVFFFFQAEDGIRDLIVTGVQTCALPISRELNDRNRKTRSGRGTFDKTMAGIRCLRDNGVPFHVLSVLSADSLAMPDEMLAFYESHDIDHVCFNVEESEGSYV